jgi:hypothetical protein
MAIHDAIQTPEIMNEGAFDEENLDSPTAALVMKTCPPKSTGQSFLKNGTESAVKRKLFRTRQSLGDALKR